MPFVLPPGDPAIPLSTPIAPTAAPSNTARRASLKVLNRNIDQVVLGNLLFNTWYYSPYPDSIILSETQVSAGTGGGSHGLSTGKQHHHHQAHPQTVSHVNGIHEENTNTLTSATADPARTTSIPCKRLHVCPYCFRYTPKSVAYVQHLRRHTVTYSPQPHPDEHSDIHTKQHNNNRSTSPTSDTSEDTSSWPVPSSAIKVYEHDGYTVWDVDGEREKLYCQNLSLFGKLFLEQKSVFFDTGGFHYFVLTYTPPPPASSSTESSTRKTSTIGSGTRYAGRRRTSSGGTRQNASTATPGTGVATNTVTSTSTSPTTNTLSTSTIPVPPDITLHTRVLGFFSKENLSWDANNLACILVFPPYQHRNLGQLLMSISYKLSGWEWEDSIIGGPEKPLSAMGRRSYLRFWSERVARFIMGQTADADGRRVFDAMPETKGERKRRKRIKGVEREEMTVKEVGDRTGMLAEDVVAALNEMAVLEVMAPKKKKRKSDGDDGPAGDEQDLNSMVVQRSKVLEWAEGKGVSLISPVKEEGFLGEWALSDVGDNEDEESVLSQEVQDTE